MKYLVLGSSGFIGSALTSFLKGKKNQVIEFDIYKSLYHDLRIINNIQLDKAINECNFIYFLAFDVGNNNYIQANDTNFDFINNNLLILYNTFNAIKKNPRPFIFISSQFAKNSELSYGLLKKIGEKYTKSLGGLYVRLWNIYGAGEKYSSKSHVITDFINEAIINNKIIVKTSGVERRQFLYIDDCVDCLFELSSIYYIVDKNQLIDITSFHESSIIEIAYIIKNTIKNIDVSVNYNNKTYTFVRSNPSKYILKFWTPKISINDGIKKTIEMILIK